MLEILGNTTISLIDRFDEGARTRNKKGIDAVIILQLVLMILK